MGRIKNRTDPNQYSRHPQTNIIKNEIKQFIFQDNDKKWGLKLGRLTGVL